MSFTIQRKTVVALSFVLTGFAGLSFWRGHEIRAEVLLGCAGVLATGAFLSNAFAAWVHRAWWRAVHATGAAHTMAVLALLYFLGFTGYRLWGRLVGKDSLGRRAPSQASYWMPRVRTHPSRWEFERLY